jgi:hypothetical protein
LVSKLAFEWVNLYRYTSDGEFDAITNVYLFHEMPKEARRNAAREYARVLKAGLYTFNSA